MSKSKSSSTNSASVWEPQTEYLSQLYGRASNTLNQQPTINNTQRSALGMMANAASGSSPMVNSVNSAYSSTLNPFSNPYSRYTNSFAAPAGNTLVNSMYSQAPTYNAPGLNYSPNLQQTSGQSYSGANLGFNPINPDMSRLMNAQGNTYSGANLGFNAQTPEAINQMMSGQVDMGVYNNMADALASKMNKYFKEDTLGSITDQAMATGNSGDWMQRKAEMMAADRHGEQLGNALTNLYGNAYNKALDQRGQGVSAFNQVQGLGLDAARSNLDAFLQQQGLTEQSRQAADQTSLGAADRFLQGQGLGLNAAQSNLDAALQQQQLSEQSRQAANQFNLNLEGMNMDAARADLDSAMQAMNLNEQARQFNQGQNLNAAQYGMGMMSDMYNNNMNTLQNAVSQGANMYNFNMMPGQTMLDVGNQYAQLPWQDLARYAQLIGGPTVLNSGTSSSRGGTASALAGIF